MEKTQLFYTNVSRIGNDICWTGYENGRKFFNRDPFFPILYTRTNQKDSPFKTIYDEDLEPTTFQSMSDARAFIKDREGSNQKVYGNTNYVFQFICDKFPNGIRGVSSKDLNICVFDLEMVDTSGSHSGFPKPEDAPIPIVSGAFYFSKTDEYVILGLKHDYIPSLPNVRYIHCEGEAILLSKIIGLFSIHAPDILTGWNIRLFDIPYLANRIDMVLGEGKSKMLSPWKRINKKSIFIKGKENVAVEIEGITQLDYLDLFKKFSLNTYGQLENYRLDTVGNVVVGERKLDYSEYSGLDELYEKDHQRFIEYNWKDVALVVRIDQQIRYIDIAMSLAYKTGVNFIDTLGTINAWDTFIYRKLLKRGVIIPPQDKSIIQGSYEGAYVKDPVPGMYEWVLSFDLASLYPNIVVQYNLSPETLVQNVYNEDASVESILSKRVKNTFSDKYAMTANGHYFRKDRQGIIAEIMEEIYSERKIVKGEMLNYEQQLQNATTESEKQRLSQLVDVSKNEQIAIKIFLNSGYGFIGSPYSRFFSKEIAEAITLTGQLTIRWAANKLNEFMNDLFKTKDKKDYIITGDTDSVFLHCDSFIDKFNPTDPVEFLNKASLGSFNPFLERIYEELFEIMGGYKNRAQMKREKIIDRGIFLGKKRYTCRVLDNEGVRYATPKIAITGIEAVKSSTPGIIRKDLKDVFAFLLDNDKKSLYTFIQDVKTRFYDSSVESIAFPRSANNIEKFYNENTKKMGTGVPINVRAAILYNQQLEKRGLEHKYREIKSGDKILWTYLRMPNPLHENVIGFVDILPKEFGLHEFVDYKTQFEKTFISVLGPILDAINWKEESEYLDSISGLSKSSKLSGASSLDAFF